MAAPAGAREAEIVSMLDVPSPDPNRMGKWDMAITYRVDPLHSFTVRIPKEDFTPEKARAAIQADWNTRKALYLSKITLT